MPTTQGLLAPCGVPGQQFLRLQASLLELDSVLRAADPSGGPADDGAARTAWALSGALDDVDDAFHAVEVDPGVLRRIPVWLLPSGLRAGTAAGPTEAVRLGGLGLLRHALQGTEPGWAAVAAKFENSPSAWSLEQLESDWCRALESDTGPSAPDPTDAWRAPAAWLPLVHRATGEAFLAVVRAVPEHADNVPGAADTTRSFREAARAGFRGALSWAATIGVPDDELVPWQEATAAVEGVPRQLRVTEASVEAAAAGALLQALLAPGPAEAVLTTGSAGPPDPAKQLAARTHNVRLGALTPGAPMLELTQQAWPRTARESVALIAQRAVLQDGHSGRVLHDPLSDLDWARVNGQALQVDLPETGRISAALGTPERCVVVGGPAASGRTTCVRQAAAIWRASTAGVVVELVCADGRLMDAPSLSALLIRSRLALQIGQQVQVLWILEDLEPRPEGTDLDAVLPSALTAAGGSIIAVCLYAGGELWSADTLITVPSVKGQAAVVRFLDTANAQPFGRTLADWELAQVRAASGGDLWLLTRLFAELASAGPTTTSHDGTLVEAIAARARAGLGTTQNRMLRVVAACSLLHVPVPPRLLGALTEAHVEKIGGGRDRHGNWRLRSPALCAAILSAGDLALFSEVRAHPVEQQFQALLPFFADSLDDEGHLRQLLRLLDNAAALAPALRRRLMRALGGRMVRCVDAATALPILAEVLLVMDEDPDREDRPQLLGHLLDGLLARGWHRLAAADAAACLRALRAYRDDAAGSRAADWREVLRSALTDLEAVTNRAGPADSLGVIRELAAFYEQFVSDAVPDLVRSALGQADPRSWRDYSAAYELLRLAGRAAPGTFQTTLDDVSTADGIVSLIRPPAEHRDAATTLGRLALIRILSGCPVLDQIAVPTLDQAALVVDAVAARSTLTRTRLGLLLIERSDRAYAHRLARRARLGTALTRPLREAPAGEAAAAVALLSRLNPAAAGSLLFDELGDPRPDVIRSLGESCTGAADLKGAGQLLTALGNLDRQLFAQRQGAGAALARELRDFLQGAVAEDIRASVVKHAVRGLIVAHCDAPQLEAIRGACLAVITREMRDNDKEHAPQLALMLASNDALGPAFLADLAPDVDTELLFHRMSSARTPQALAAFHDLGRTLAHAHDPELLDRFTLEWLRPALAHLGNGSVLQQLEAAAAIAETVSAARIVDDAAATVLGHHGHQMWAERLQKVKHPGILTSCLEILLNMSPAGARRIVDALARKLGGHPAAPAVAPLRVEPREGSPNPLWLVPAQSEPAAPSVPPLDGLVGWLGRAFLQPEQILGLLGVLDKIEPGLGVLLGAELQQLASWPARQRALLDEIENPVQLGEALRRMRVLGFEPHRDVVAATAQTWIPRADAVRSPIAAAALLRGFAASGTDGELASEWADRLQPSRLGERLAQCLPMDLAVLPPLLDALRVWGPPGKDVAVAANVPPNAIALSGPGDASRLLLALRRSSAALAHAHAPAAAELLITSLNEQYQVNPERAWLAIGWLGTALEHVGARPAIPEDATERILAATTHPAVRLWALTGLGLDAPAHAAEAVALLRRSIPRAWVHAATMLALFRCPQPVGTDPYDDLLVGALDASPPWIVEMLEQTETNHYAASLLKRDATWLHDNGRWLADNGDPLGADIAAAATRLSLKPSRQGA